MNEFAGSVKEYAAGGVGIVSLTAGGTGYATDRGYPAGLSTASVIFSGGGGHGATGVAYVNVSSGAIRALEITDPGKGYSGTVNVEIRGGHAAGVSTSQATACYAWGTTQVAPSEYFGFEFGNHDNVGRALGAFTYFNRLGSLMGGGYSNLTYSGFGWSAEDTYNYTSEFSFIHKEWYEEFFQLQMDYHQNQFKLKTARFGKLVLFNNGEVHYSGYGGHGQAWRQCHQSQNWICQMWLQ